MQGRELIILPMDDCKPGRQRKKLVDTFVFYFPHINMQCALAFPHLQVSNLYCHVTIKTSRPMKCFYHLSEYMERQSSSYNATIKSLKIPLTCETTETKVD